jgi:hypothetical protein
MNRILDSELSYAAPKNYTIPVYELKPNEISNMYFIVVKKETYKRLIQFRMLIKN